MNLTLSIVISSLLTALNADQPATMKQLYPLVGGIWEMRSIKIDFHYNRVK